MKRLRLGAILHFIIAIGHLGCLFALDEAFDAYGIKEVMHNMVFGHVWMLYALTFCLALAFALAGFYALSSSCSTAFVPWQEVGLVWRISVGFNFSRPSFLPLSRGAIILALKIDEANSRSPVYVADRIVSAIAFGGCNDCALLGALPDSWIN